MLIYDGDCAFCQRTARWIGRRLPEGTPVVAWQDTDIAALGLDADDVTTAAYWIDDDGRRHRGHRAIARALRVAGGAWALIGVLLVVPPISWLAAGVYRLVAANRHRMPGGTEACRLEVERARHR